MFTLPCRHRAIHEKTRVHTKEEKPRVENPYQYQNYTGSARWNLIVGKSTVGMHNIAIIVFFLVP
eukprot:SAG11_NODE_1024_length_6148_cov_7.090263_5_plen_65_part_00